MFFSVAATVAIIRFARIFAAVLARGLHTRLVFVDGCVVMAMIMHTGSLPYVRKCGHQQMWRADKSSPFFTASMYRHPSPRRWYRMLVKSHTNIHAQQPGA